MCRHFSCLLTRSNVYTAESGKHEEMIREAGLRDDTREPDFARVEVTPPDEDYSLPPERWEYRVDQDYLPPWYVATVEEERARRALAAWYATHVQRDGEQVVNDGEFRIAIGTCRQTINRGAGYAFGHAAQTINGGRGLAFGHSTQTINGGAGSALGHSTQTINGGMGRAHDNASQTINGGLGDAIGPNVTVIDNRKD